MMHEIQEPLDLLVPIRHVLSDVLDRDVVLSANTPVHALMDECFDDSLDGLDVTYRIEIELGCDLGPLTLWDFLLGDDFPKELAITLRTTDVSRSRRVPGAVRHRRGSAADSTGGDRGAPVPRRGCVSHHEGDRRGDVARHFALWSEYPDRARLDRKQTNRLWSRLRWASDVWEPEMEGLPPGCAGIMAAVQLSVIFEVMGWRWDLYVLATLVGFLIWLVGTSREGNPTFGDLSRRFARVIEMEAAETR